MRHIPYAHVHLYQLSCGVYMRHIPYAHVHLYQLCHVECICGIYGEYHMLTCTYTSYHVECICGIYHMLTCTNTSYAMWSVYAAYTICSLAPIPAIYVMWYRHFACQMSQIKLSVCLSHNDFIGARVRIVYDATFNIVTGGHFVHGKKYLFVFFLLKFFNIGTHCYDKHLLLCYYINRRIAVSHN